MNDSETVGQEEPRGVSRRTLAKGAAWAVPVIAITAAAPAYAVSGGVLNFSGIGCKLPGNANETYKGNLFRLSASNTTNASVTVTITSITLAGSSLGTATIIDLDTCTTLTQPFTLLAGQSYPNLVLVTSDAGNSQNGSLVVNYTVSGTASAPATVSVSDLPPITNGGGSCTAFTASERTCLKNKGVL